MCTSRYPEHPHDPDDGGVDWERGVDLDFLQGDAHHGQQHDGQVQLVPPAGDTRRVDGKRLRTRHCLSHAEY